MAIYGGTYMDDLLVGMSGDDILWGGMGDDTLQGGAGDDRLRGGPGADVINGGPGMDIADYADSMAGVNIDLSSAFVLDEDLKPRVFGGDAEGDTLTSVEIIWGSAFADRLVGSHGMDYFFGNAGDDEIMGGDGNDMLRGGDDSDLVQGDDGDDTLYGDADDDTIEGGPGDDMLFGGEHDDALYGQGGDDVLEGGPGADMLYGGPHSAKALGGDTASYTMSPEGVVIRLHVPFYYPNPDLDDPEQVLAAGGDATGDDYDGIENIRGSMHDDIIIGGVSADGNVGGNIVWGNAGDDLIVGHAHSTFASMSTDTFFGGKGNDTLQGGNANDKLYGQIGDDRLEGGDDDDTLDGGPGADELFGGRRHASGASEDSHGENGDTADYSKSPEAVTIDLGALSPTGQAMPSAKGGHAEGDMLYGIENVTGTDYTDLLIGDAEANHLKGGDGDDWDDPDTPRVTEGGLFGGGGNDTLDGGRGNDWLDASESVAGESVILKGGSGNDMLIGGAGNDGTAAVAAVAAVVAGDGTVTTPAVAAKAVVYGLDGGNGDDTLAGGAGADQMNGSNGNDTADYSDSEDGVRVSIDSTMMFDASDTGTPGALVTATTPATAGHTAAYGGDASTGTFSATPADNTFRADVLNSIESIIGSEDGDNFLIGDRRPNMLTGGDGAGVGVAVTRDGDGVLTAATNPDATGPGVVTEAEVATFDDVLIGNGGNDVLVGGEGGDWFMGGAGADTFVVGRQDDNHNDFIGDFSSSAGDKIDLSDLNLSENELRAILRQSTARPDATTGVLTLDLSGEGGGTLTVRVTEAFTGLELDDFII